MANHFAYNAHEGIQFFAALSRPVSAMPITRLAKLQRALVVLATLLIFKVTAEVVWGYRNYFPPNFSSDFLHGRESYFFGAYQWAFYVHIAAGPIAMIVGTILISEPFRRRFPQWHRAIGRIQVATILLAVAPSGLWMAYYAAPGIMAAISFASLAIATGTCAALGLRAAVQRQFAVHRRWMWRCYLLLCAAVVLRLMGGLATVCAVQAEWFDPLASWACWLAPLAVFEWLNRAKRRPTQLPVLRTESSPATEMSARHSAAGNSALRNRTLPSTNAAFIPPG